MPHIVSNSDTLAIGAEAEIRIWTLRAMHEGQMVHGSFVLGIDVVNRQVKSLGIVYSKEQLRLQLLFAFSQLLSLELEELPQAGMSHVAGSWLPDLDSPDQERICITGITAHQFGVRIWDLQTNLQYTLEFFKVRVKEVVQWFEQLQIFAIEKQDASEESGVILQGIVEERELEDSSITAEVVDGCIVIVYSTSALRQALTEMFGKEVAVKQEEYINSLKLPPQDPPNAVDHIITGPMAIALLEAWVYAELVREQPKASN